MASNLPISQTAWLAVIPQLLLMAALVYGFSYLSFGSPLLFGALVYLGLSFALRNLVPREHRRGMKFIRQEKFTEAISAFERSVAFFTRNSWVDRFRFLTVLSASKISFREMGLCNIAFCYSQIGEGAKAIEFYERAMEAYPESGIAKVALKALRTVNEGQN